MSKNKYSISASSISPEELYRLYAQAKQRNQLNKPYTELDYIFDIAANHRSLFPAIDYKGTISEEIYVERWVKSYCDAENTLPSQREAKPKGSCSDPALRVLVQTTQGLTEEQDSIGESNHDLFMAAENLQGNLLEEYIANRIRPYGFVWANGNVLKAIDFITTDGSLLLQIKNKYNTENSSGSDIREGTTIEKWYRLGVRTVNHQKVPNFKWSELNELINKYKTEGFDLPPCNMSEDDYRNFLSDAVRRNPHLLSGD